MKLCSCSLMLSMLNVHMQTNYRFIKIFTRSHKVYVFCKDAYDLNYQNATFTIFELFKPFWRWEVPKVTEKTCVHVCLHRYETFQWRIIHKLRMHWRNGVGEGVRASAYANVFVNGWCQKHAYRKKGGVNNSEKNIRTYFMVRPPPLIRETFLNFEKNRV